MANAMSRAVKAFRKEDGGLTVEAVLWLPLFLGFVAFIADASLILHGQAQVQRITQDANRAFSTGNHQDTLELEEALRTRLAGVVDNVAVSALASGPVVQTQVSIQTSDLVALGIISAISDLDLSFTSYHVLERDFPGGTTPVASTFR